MLCANPPPAEARLSPAARVTSAIADALKRGVRPWTRPWSADGAISLPRRANGDAYKGVNTVALWATALERGFVSPYWLTFKQTQALKASVRKGEHGAYIVYYGDRQAREDDANNTAADTPRRQRVLRGYTVFCADQIDGLPEQFHAPASAPVPLSDRETTLLASVGRIPAIVQHGGDRAYYAPASDQIHLPARTVFSSFGPYLITRLHESAHWTRDPSRLDRDFGQKRFGDAGYALEELVAELAAAMLGATLEVPGDHIEDHAGTSDHGWTCLQASLPHSSPQPVRPNKRATTSCALFNHPTERGPLCAGTSGVFARRSRSAPYKKFLTTMVVEGRANTPPPGAYLVPGGG